MERNVERWDKKKWAEFLEENQDSKTQFGQPSTCKGRIE